jgi:iron complex outermembrane recepter protein
MQSHTKAKSTSRSRKAFPLNPLAASLAAILMASAPAYAQDTKTEEEKTEEAKKKQAADEPVVLESVKVQGFQRAVEKSIQAKRDNTSIVEVIAAEDIGKLPDNSIADAISRAPGLTAQRVNGRASAISIRGASPDYSTTLLNGREQVSVGDNRGVEFDQYPSELIGGVTIYKTPDAKLIGQGLSGTVDLQTIKPLTYSDRTVTLSARLEENSLGEINPGYTDRGNRISATYIDQFADRTIGLAIGFARLDSPGQNERWRAWGFPDGDSGVSGTPNRSIRALGGSQFYASSTEQVRTGIMGVLEYKPNDVLHSTLDVFYSRFDKTETTRGMETGLAWSGAAPSNLQISGFQVLGGTYTGIEPVLRNDENTSDDKIFSVGWNNKIRLNDDWTAVIDINGSSAERNDTFTELYARALTPAGAPIASNVSYVINPNTGLPTFAFSGEFTNPAVVRLTDISGWGQAGYTKSPEIRDDQIGFRANFKRDFLEGPFSSIEFGVNYSDREKSRASNEFFLDLKTAPTAIAFLEPSAPLNLTGGVPVVAINIPLTLASGIYNFRSNNLANPDVFNKNWQVNEEVKTGFVQLNIESEIGNVGVRGNVGLQYQMTDQNSDGFAVNSGVAVPYSDGAKYNDLLPSLNLAFELPHDQVVRFGAAKTLARARMDDLRANNNYGCNTGGAGVPLPFCRWEAGGGNPQLEPTRANAYDISYEKYFETKAQISLAYFFKDLRTYTYTDRNDNFDFSGFTPLPGTTPISSIGRFTQPRNGTGGYLRGLEFNAVLPFSMFSDALDGFGLILNASDIDSSIPGDGPQTGPDAAIESALCASNSPYCTNPRTTFPGLSEFSANATIYFERGGFSARASHRYRDDFYGEVTGFGADRARVFIEAESITDLQFGYQFKSGRFEGLSLLLQVNNLTNERYAQYANTPVVDYNNSLRLTVPATQINNRRPVIGYIKTPTLYGEYGRSILLGATYKF